MASVDNILNELAAFLSEIVWRIRVNLGMQSADSKPTPIEFGFDDKKISTPEIAGKYQVPKIYLPSNFKALVSASTVNLVKMRGVMAKIAQEMGDGMVVRYNKLGRRNYAPVCVFTPKTSDVPGWLGHVCGYGHYVRMLAMKELAWKRAENPWDWHRGTNIPEENKVWMKVRCEPPPTWLLSSQWNG